MATIHIRSHAYAHRVVGLELYGLLFAEAEHGESVRVWIQRTDVDVDATVAVTAWLQVGVETRLTSPKKIVNALEPPSTE